MNTIPAQVRVGPYPFAIHCDHERIAKVKTDHRDVWVRGETDTAANTITLDPEQHPMGLRSTLLHEVLHACWFVVAENRAKLTQEEAAAGLASILLDTMRRNPGLVAYLLADSD